MAVGELFRGSSGRVARPDERARCRYRAAVPESHPQLIADRYRLVSRIGQGGMGRVWAARDELLARDVAVKELVPPAGSTDPELPALRERAIREARAIAMLDQPNVVRIFDVIFHRGDPWIVMELVPSRSLFDTVRDEGPMAPDRAARVGLGVLAALRAAHRVGLLHRDVKPGNVLLAHDGRVVLTDFGLAIAAGDASVTSTGVVLGSPQYLAPERALDGAIGPAADLWALGATLYTAVEGRPPYVRSSPMATLAALATELPPPPERAGALRHALTALLRRDPADRADADTAQRLLLAATVPGTAPPAELPAYREPTFAVPARPEAPASPALTGSASTGSALTGSASTSPVLTSPIPARGPASAGAGAISEPSTVPDRPAPGSGRRSGPRRRAAVLAVLGAAALLGGGLLAYPMTATGTTIGPQPEAAVAPPVTIGEAGGPAPGASARPTRSRPPVSPSRRPSSAAPSAKPAGPTATGPTATGPTATGPTATATTAAGVATGRRIRSMGTGTCLHAAGDTGQVRLRSCGDDTGQRFSHPSDGTLRVRGKCVEAAGSGDGAALSLAPCTGDLRQQFDYNASYDLVSLWAVKCIDIPGASAADDVAAQLWECTGAAHQKWTY